MSNTTPMLRAWSDVYTVSFLRVSESSVRHLRKIKCKRSSLVFLCWASVCWEPSKSRNATRMQFLIHSWIGLMQQVLGRQQRRMLNKPIYLQHINGRRGRVCGWYHPKAKCISEITEAPTPIPETKHRQCWQIWFDPVDKTQTTPLCD